MMHIDMGIFCIFKDGGMSNREITKKACYTSNNVGKRLEWVRTKLDLLLVQVSNDTNIPYSSLHDRETAHRTVFYEEMLLLAAYYDKKWRERFTVFPKYEGDEVRSITFSWLCLGFDPAIDGMKGMIEEIQDNFKARELEYIREKEFMERELRAQLDMFNNES